MSAGDGDEGPRSTAPSDNSYNSYKLLEEDEEEAKVVKIERDSEGFKHPRWMGYVYQVVTVLLTCCQHILSKVLFEKIPTLTPTHLLFFQSLISSAIFTVLLNKEISHYLYHAIQRKHYIWLALRILQGLIMLGCVYTSVRYLPLVYVALVSNLGPLFTALMSYLWLSKGLSSLDVRTLGVSFFGVVLLITGSVTSQTGNAIPSD